MDAVPVHLDPAVFAPDFDPGAGNPEHHRKPYLRDTAANETSEFIAVRSEDRHHRVRLDFFRLQDFETSLAAIVLEADRKTCRRRQLLLDASLDQPFHQIVAERRIVLPDVMIAPKPTGSPLCRYRDAAHQRQRIGQDRAVYLGDAPEPVRIPKIEIREMIEPLAVAPQMLAELVLRRHIAAVSACTCRPRRSVAA